MPGYMFVVREDGSFTVSSGNAPGIVQISGTYDDLADQAIYGVLELSGGVQNNICTSDAELLAYATSVATESQRDKRFAQVRFNPFLELGDVVTYQTGTYFVARLQHNMNPDELWTTTVELWGVA